MFLFVERWIQEAENSNEPGWSIIIKCWWCRK